MAGGRIGLCDDSPKREMERTQPDKEPINIEAKQLTEAHVAP